VLDAKKIQSPEAGYRFRSERTVRCLPLFPILALLHAPGTGLSVNLSWILGRAYCVAYWTKVQ
jgi:hypothetical protein